MSHISAKNSNLQQTPQDGDEEQVDMMTQPLTTNHDHEQEAPPHRQEPLDGSGISDANMVEYEDASKKDLNRDLLLSFNADLNEEIVKLESIPIPCTDDKYLGPRGSMFVVMIIFCLPFLWTIANPFLQLNPPEYVYFDNCKLTNDTYYENQPGWYEQPTTIGLFGGLSFDDCVKCNGNGTNRISTKGVNILHAFSVSDLATVFTLFSTLYWVITYYYMLFQRTKRNEILLCYGIFLRPLPFSLRSMGGIIIIMSLASTIGCSVYISTLTGAVERNIRKLVRFGEHENTDFCLDGPFKGHRIAPVFSDNNPCFGNTAYFDPISMASGWLPFIPIILTLYRLINSPFKNISSLDVFSSFEKFKESVKYEVREDCFNEAVGEALVEKYKQDNQGKSKLMKGVKMLTKPTGLGAVFKKYSQVNSFAVDWGTTLEEVSIVYHKAKQIEKKKLAEEEKKKMKQQQTAPTTSSNGNNGKKEESSSSPAPNTNYIAVGETTSFRSMETGGNDGQQQQQQTGSENV